MECRFIIVERKNLDIFFVLKNKLLQNIIDQHVILEMGKMLSIINDEPILSLTSLLYLKNISKNEMDFRRKVAKLDIENVIHGKGSFTMAMQHLFYYTVSNPKIKTFFYVSPGLLFDSSLWQLIEKKNLEVIQNMLASEENYFMITNDEQELYSNKIISANVASKFICEINKVKESSHIFNELIDTLGNSEYYLILQTIM